jgi:hypothetical protein
MALHNYIFYLLFVACSGYALMRGGMPERLSALSLFVALIATLISVNHQTRSMIDTSGYSRFQYGVAATDFALFAANVLIAVYSTRFWTLIMASMLGCEVMVHVARAIFGDQIAVAYYAAVAIWSFPTLAVLFVGTRNHRKRIETYGVDYDWVWEVPDVYR